jgi:2-methylaconitate cis-trans-isomerase PrpF
MPHRIGIPVAWYRGGTGKALFVLQKDLPLTDPAHLDTWIPSALQTASRLTGSGVT